MGGDISLADHARTVASKQFLISPENHYSKVFNTFDSLPCTGLFWVYCTLPLASFASACQTKCIFLARSSQFLSGVSVPNMVNLQASLRQAQAQA